MATARLDSIQARIKRLNMDGWTCLIMENQATWAANMWLSPAAGILYGDACMNKSNGEIRLTDMALGSGTVYWPVDIGDLFTLSLQFRTGRGSGGLFFIALYKEIPVNMAAGPEDGEVRVLRDAGSVQVRLFGKNFVCKTPFPMNGTNGAWSALTITLGPSHIQVTIGDYLCETFPVAQPTKTTSKYHMAITAINWYQNGGANEFALKEVSLWTRAETIGQDARLLAVNEVEYPTYVLVRSSNPPPNAVTFGAHKDLGPIFAAFCHTWSHGCMPCKVTPDTVTGFKAWYTGPEVLGASNSVGNSTYTSTFFFYIVPKPGYWAVPKRVLATSTDPNPAPPRTAVYVETYRDASNPRLPLYLVVQERWQETVTYGRFERTTTGARGEVEIYGPKPLTYDGSWSYVCIMPCTTKYRYMLLPRGTAVTETTNASWDSQETLGSGYTVDANELTLQMERRPYITCAHFQGETGFVAYYRGSPWPLRTTGLSTWTTIIRCDDYQGAKPKGSVDGASYKSVDYVDTARNLRWRWLDGWGWYLNIRPS